MAGEAWNGKRFAVATLAWLPASEGGRSNPFTGLFYFPLALFGRNRAELEAGMKASLPPLNVSVVVGFDTGITQSPEECLITFFVPEAPQEMWDNLTEGYWFALYEGARATAVGQIIRSAPQV